MTQHAGRRTGSISVQLGTASVAVFGNRRSRAVLTFVSSFVLSSALCHAQGAPTAGGGSQAVPLPLSGRAQGGTVTSTQNPIPGATTSVVTLNPAIQIQGPFSGSVVGVARSPFSGKLSLGHAVRRGLDYNLGLWGIVQAVRQARGQQKTARGALLPNITGDLTGAAEKVNLAAFGITQVGNFPLPATVVGPFSLVDLRAKLSQTVFDLT